MQNFKEYKNNFCLQYVKKIKDINRSYHNICFLFIIIAPFTPTKLYHYCYTRDIKTYKHNIKSTKCNYIRDNIRNI